jgi:hypothetical protein
MISMLRDTREFIWDADSEAFLRDVEAAAVELGFTAANIEAIVRGYDRLAAELRESDRLAAEIQKNNVPKSKAVFWRSRGRGRLGKPWREWSFERWCSSSTSSTAPEGKAADLLPDSDASSSTADRLASRYRGRS